MYFKLRGWFILFIEFFTKKQSLKTTSIYFVVDIYHILGQHSLCKQLSKLTYHQSD